MSKKSKDDSRKNPENNIDEQRRENISDEVSSGEFASDLQADDQSDPVPVGSVRSCRTGERSGTLSRRRFLGSMGAAAVAAAVGCKDRSPSDVDVDAGPDPDDDGGVDADGGPDIVEDGGVVVVEDGGQNGGEEGPDLSVLRAFPGAEGSGALSAGGRGGTIYEVTNLNDEGPGSLRAACEASGPRIVIFRVSGNIVLNSRIRIRNPYITIAGQTAPGGGIQLACKEPGTVPNEGSSGPDWRTVRNDERPTLIRVETHDVIIRYLRLRPGYVGYCSSCPGTGIANAISIENATTSSSRTHVEDVILDHITVMWGSNLNLGIYDSYGERRFQRFSIQNSIMAETLYGRPQHVVGASKTRSETAGDEMGDIDFHRNLWSTSFGRVPLIGADTRWINNIFYNTDNYLARVGGEKTDSAFVVDLVGNIFDHGPVHRSSSRGKYEIGVVKQDDNPSTLYVSGNWGDRHGYDNYNMVGQPNSTGGSDDWAPVAPDLYRRDSPKPSPVIPVNAIDVDELEDTILPDIGASRRLDHDGYWVFNRDTTDVRVIEEGYKQRTQDFLVMHEDEVGGYPVLADGTPYPHSGDGISDAWKERNGFSTSADIGAQEIPNLNGWTYLDLFLAGMDLPT